MKIVYAFDCDGPGLSGAYGDDILRLMLNPTVLSRSQKSIRVSVGDLLTSTRIQEVVKNAGWNDVAELNLRILAGSAIDTIDRPAVRALTGKSEIACWLVENLDPELAWELHESLRANAGAYLGMADVRFDNPAQRRFLSNGLVRKYRLQGTNAALFYPMNDPENADFIDTDVFEDYSYKVTREDTGLRWTTFDQYYTDAALAGRVELFEELISRLPGIDPSLASDATFFVEELHPNLFNNLHALTRAIERAETVDELAHAALSGRRFLQNFADYLYEAVAVDPNVRRVTKDKFKNRIWAYLDVAVGHGTPAQTTLGQRFDSLNDFFNAAIHSSRSRGEVEAHCAELILAVCDLIRANPAAARNPYRAYAGPFMESMGIRAGRTKAGEAG